MILENESKSVSMEEPETKSLIEELNSVAPGTGKEETVPEKISEPETETSPAGECGEQDSEVVISFEDAGSGQDITISFD